jgi:hypothetical protein
MGSKTPPKEPDYTKERAAYAQSEYARRQQQAAKYNTAIQNYNSRLANLNSLGGTLSTGLKGLKLTDDELFGSWDTKINDLQGRFNNLQASRVGSLDMPSWSSVVSSPYGSVEVGIPKLYSRNDNLALQLESGIGSARTALEDLRSRRTAEEKRIDDYNSQLESYYSGVDSGLGGLTIADLDGINTSRRSLSEMLAQVKGFSSAILSDYKPTLAQTWESRITGANSKLDQLMQQRKAEEDRIRNYEMGLNSAYDGFSSRFGALTIADEAGMKALQDEIDARQLEAGRFSSLLDYDLSQELSPLDSLEGKLGGLMAKREQELSRIEQAKEQARMGIGSIQSMLGNADIYNLGTLNQIQSAIDEGQMDLSGFSSVLPFDFGAANADLSTAEGRLQQLMAQREAALAGYVTKAGDLTSRINGLDLTNESGISSGISDAQALLAQLGRFTGNDINDVRTQVENALAAGDTKMKQLVAERGGIENAARALLTSAKTTGYTSGSQLDALAQQLNELTGRQTSYGAYQALDEIDAIAALIASERERIAAEQKAAQEATQTGGRGYGSYYAGQAPWMIGGGRYFPGQLPSSFARQLQAVYM